MGRTRRIVLGLGFLVLLAVLMFPPWRYSFMSRNLEWHNPAGHAFAFVGPESAESYWMRSERARLIVREPKTAIDYWDAAETERQIKARVPAYVTLAYSEIDTVRLLTYLAAVIVGFGGLVVALGRFSRVSGELPGPDRPGLADAPPSREYAHRRPLSSKPRTGGLKIHDGARDQPVGIGGWLFWLCLGLTVIIPLWTFLCLRDTYQGLLPLYSRYPTTADLNAVIIYFAISALLVSFGIYAGVSLWRKNPEAIILTKGFPVSVPGVRAISPLVFVLAGRSVGDLFVEGFVQAIG